jgi:PhzF family phenazine biosynthesis protein
MKFWQVDAFTDTPFKGNPAAVVVHEKELDDELMQNIAIENNLSETAFIYLREGQNPLLRWFTPTMEIDLCGHATLAAAHIYLTEILPQEKSVVFDTKFVGELKVEKTGNNYSMNFPARPGKELELKDVPDFVTEALHFKKPIAAYKARDLMLIYDDESVITEIKPDFNALKNYKDFIIITAKSKDSKYDFISRFFCADDGIAEDPVTGSAHCTSTPIGQKFLIKKY